MDFPRVFTVSFSHAFSCFQGVFVPIPGVLLGYFWGALGFMSGSFGVKSEIVKNEMMENEHGIVTNEIVKNEMVKNEMA